MAHTYVGLDFETYSGVDLITHGLHRYINDDTFRPLIAVVKWRNDDNQVVGLPMDFVKNYDEERELLAMLLEDQQIVAHNAGFEHAVLQRMGLRIPINRFIDSAVIARAMGAAGKLEAAGPQLLNIDKLETGWPLIQKFSIPGKYQEAAGTLAFDPDIRADNMDDWAEFARYCDVDAELGMRLFEMFAARFPTREHRYTELTMRMNDTGWHVDMQAVNNMFGRYMANLEATKQDFRMDNDEWELNLSSFPQLKKWCEERGVKTSSFDEQHVAHVLNRVNKRLLQPGIPEAKRRKLQQVQHLMQTKQAMGGSSLKKLQTIINTVGTDGRLHDQYLHVGAGATYRTTGRGVQMQNLPRLHGGGDDMFELLDERIEWDNHKLGTNLRQVFTASQPNGFMIVGDFASVESRGLAWQAGEQWKIDAYFAGQDLYKVQAGLIFGKSHADVTKDERQTGKVGELACGYGAGGEAVQAFARNMGVELSEGEATKLVRDWRAANPKIVDYWHQLDAALHEGLEKGLATVKIPHGHVRIERVLAPQSLLEIDQDVCSLWFHLHLTGNHQPVLSRVIHGVHVRGRNLGYYKPSERKTGDLWSKEFTDPKTGQRKRYSVYGGKLAGLLTQSLCREVFFTSLDGAYLRLVKADNVRIVGQFHDEIVLDWVPGAMSLEDTKAELEKAMTSTILPAFPLAAEIKHDFRYTK